MVCAAVPKASRLPARISGLLVAGIAVLFFLTCLSPRAPAAVLLLGGTFYLLVSGCTVLGLLISRPIRWLGSISYGVYLLHGLVLSRLRTIGAVREFALASPAHHWLMVLLATGLVLGHHRRKLEATFCAEFLIYETGELVRVTSSASLAAMSAIGISAVSRPFREASMGLTSRRASYVVLCTTGTS